MPVLPVTRALVPCGGRGTRMQTLTAGAPKEMIPVAGTPVIEWVLRECVASGVDELLVITAPGKEALVEYLGTLAGAPGMPVRLDVVMQPEPRGLADAIRLGRDFASGAPLAVALSDNLFLGHTPALAQVLETHARTGTNVVAIVEITAEAAGRRGPTAVLPGSLHGEDFHIARIPDKGARGATFSTAGARSAFTAVGRYVFTPDVFAVIDEVERTLAAGAELDDVPVMQQLLAQGRLIGRRIAGDFLDVGLPQGYAEASARLAEQPGR